MCILTPAALDLWVALPFWRNRMWQTDEASTRLASG